MESTLTYRTLYDKVIDLVISLCDNIPDISTIPEAMKAGFSKKIAEIQGTPVNAPNNPPIVYRVEIENPVVAVSEEEVRYAFQEFMTSRGIYDNLDATVSGRGMLNFLSNVAVFCRSHVCKTSSPFVEGEESFTIYYVNGLSVNVSSYTLPDFVTALDVSDMVNIIKNVLTSNMSLYEVKYKYYLIYTDHIQ